MARRVAGLIAAAALAALALAPAAAANGAAAPAAGAAPERITFYFGLERPEAAAQAAWAAVGDPTSSSYRRFATLRQAAGRYGATPATVSAFRRAARRHGFTLTLDRSRVFARVSGTVAQFRRLFGKRIGRSFDNDVLADISFISSARALRLPADMRPLVREVVAAYSRSTRPPGMATEAQAGPPPGNAGTWGVGCRKARATGGYSFDQVRTAYGLDAAGDGAGARIGIVNIGEGLEARDIRAGAACFGLPPLSWRMILSDGQAAPFGYGSPEPQEDLALARGMAPGARSVTFVQAWLATQLWFLGFSEALAASPRPDVLSVSYGFCEPFVRGPRAQQSARASAGLTDALLVRLGLVGVSAFASAGDSGSTCNGQPFPGVAWPASSPYITAVGGTRLVVDAANARVDEVVWNDLPWLPSDNGGGAGGGGTSAFSARPAYQSATGQPGSRRTVPDVAAHASMLPGWPVSFAGNWVEDSGTSAASPLVAGGFAVLIANERAAGRPPLGPVNGLLYRLRATRPASFFDVVSGQNRFTARVPGISAAPGYDRASGLGVPRFDQLGAALPAPGSG